MSLAMASPTSNARRLKGSVSEATNGLALTRTASPMLSSGPPSTGSTWPSSCCAPDSDGANMPPWCVITSASTVFAVLRRGRPRLP
eukprot:5295392-Pyramimonas_sp.AAC.1